MSFLRWKVGAITVTSIVETEVFRPVVTIFGRQNDSIEPHRPWLDPYLAIEDGSLLLKFSIQTFGVEIDGWRMLVDTCIGNGKSYDGDPDLSALDTPFIDDLAAAGFPPDDVAAVVCTHLHRDHVGWNTRLVDGRWEPTFPNARYIITARDLDYWRAHAALDNPFTTSVEPLLAVGIVDAVESDAQINRHVRLFATPGHSAGHSCVLIADGRHEALITGDVAVSPVQLVDPAWSQVRDYDPELSLASRHRLVERVENGNVLVLGTHFPAPTAGYVLKESGHRVFLPNGSA